MATLPEVDACIVGLGAAGGILAKELTAAGMNVVGLNLGPFLRTMDFQFHDELRFSVRQELLQPKISETPMQYRTSASAAAAPGRPWTISDCVGGGSVHYGTWNWRMLPHHFKIKSEVTARYGAAAIPAGANIVDWPISYNDLAPYYDKVDTELGTSGKAGNINGAVQAGGNPFEGPRGKDFPLPPLIQTTGSRIFSGAAAQMGYKPFPTPVGIISQQYDGRPGCTYCGYCSGYGCHVGAKSSTLVSVIPKAVATGKFEIRPYCRVTKINGDGTKATGVTYRDAAGAEQEQPAGLIILACYTWEVVRLMLLSGINKSGLVGKYFMSHQYQFVRGVFDNLVTNPSEGQTGADASMDEFNGDNFDHTGLGFIEGASITSTGGNTQAIVGTTSVAPANFRQVGTDTSWGQTYKDFIKKYFRRQLGLIAQLPNLPYEANYLELDPSVKDALGIPVLRVTYDGYDNEKKAGTYLQDKMEAILRKAGAADINRGPNTIPPWNNHEVGGTRMGDDPAASVVNRYGQSHELPNLFVASGATFPTYFGYNPTHTIEALAYYSGNFITNEAKTGGSLAKYLA